MIVAFIVSGALGLFVEWAMIRHLYKRPLDTLLATWGLSLILQQIYRSRLWRARGGRYDPRLDDGVSAADRSDRGADQRDLS